MWYNVNVSRIFEQIKNQMWNTNLIHKMTFKRISNSIKIMNSKFYYKIFAHIATITWCWDTNMCSQSQSLSWTSPISFFSQPFPIPVRNGMNTEYIAFNVSITSIMAFGSVVSNEPIFNTVPPYCKGAFFEIRPAIDEIVLKAVVAKNKWFMIIFLDCVVIYFNSSVASGTWACKKNEIL